MLGMASGLTIFTIHAELGPVREKADTAALAVIDIRQQERKTFEMLIRHDERLRMEGERK